jgi:hypothetical protein
MRELQAALLEKAFKEFEEYKEYKEFKDLRKFGGGAQTIWCCLRSRSSWQGTFGAGIV